MNASEFVREFTWPARNLTVLFSALFIFLLLEFAAFGKLLGLFLAFLVLPSLFHYLMRILDKRARGAEPGPLEVDDLYWFQGAWSLFMIVHVVLAIAIVVNAARYFGAAGQFVATTLVAAVIPASLAVLAVSKSPLESLNPRAIGALIGVAGADYWTLPTYLLVAGFAVRWLAAAGWPGFVVDLLAFYLLLVFFSMTGAVVRPHNLHDEVDIYEPVEKPPQAQEAALLRERTGVLNHAYGFISRDNRAGGFRHIESWLQRDPDPEQAWAWFFEQMLRWENKTPALVFGQSYVSELLKAGDDVTAIKVMMRCRLENPDFVPHADDLPLAADAAERRQNHELAAFLRSRVRTLL